MHQSLRDLTDLYLFFEKEKGCAMCSLYFKGKFDEASTIYADELFGDLMFLAWKRASISDALNSKFTRTPWEVEIWEEDRIERLINQVSRHPQGVDGIDSVADVVEVAFENAEAGQMWFVDIIEFLCTLTENNIPFSKEAFEAFVFSYQVYVPICKRMKIGNQRPASFAVEEFLNFESMLDVLNHSREDNTVYHYTCDTLNEILMSLLHYFAIMNFSIKRCERCGRWFSPRKKSDEKYCMRVYGDKTCKELATAEKRRKRLDNTPLQKKYNSINTSLSNRANACAIDECERERRLKILYTLRNEWPKKRKEMDGKTAFEWLDTFRVGGDNNA